MTKEFGGLVAVNDVSFDIQPHSIVSIIGPNGAGKTTFFNMLTGLYKPTSGRIVFDGTRHHAARGRTGSRAMGVARTFQNIRLFGAMSALENVMIGRHSRMRAGVFGSILRPPWVRREERVTRERARELLAYVGLRRDAVGQLSARSSPTATSGASRSRARSPAEPKLLLLDEPTAGMNPQESAALTDFMRKLRDELELTILLIEHDMKVVMDVSERDHRARPRREDRRGAAGRGARQPAGDRGLPGKAGLMSAARGRRHPRPLRRDRGAQGRLADGRGGRGRDPDRLQRRRQVDHAALDLGSDAGELAARSRSTARTSPACPPTRSSSAASRSSPEGRHCFARMTVRENLDLGAYHRRGSGDREDLERVFELFPRLQERENQKAGTMSGGEQQMLAIGRALMARPKLLMLDEPSMGIAPILVQRIYETIGEINRQGVAILLVEQNANYALDISKRGYVLETGRVALANDSDQLRDDPEVQRAYLGTDGDDRFALIGAKALYLLFLWLISAAARRWLSERKGYGERVGLTFGLLLTVVGLVIVLLLPGRPGLGVEGARVRSRKAPADRARPLPGAEPPGHVAASDGVGRVVELVGADAVDVDAVPRAASRPCGGRARRPLGRVEPDSRRARPRCPASGQ